MTWVEYTHKVWLREDFEGLVFPSLMYFNLGGTSYAHNVIDFGPDGIRTSAHTLLYEDMDDYHIRFQVKSLKLKRYNIEKIKGT